MKSRLLFGSLASTIIGVCAGVYVAIVSAGPPPQAPTSSPLEAFESAAPGLPEGLCVDERTTWRPTLNASPVAVVEMGGIVRSYKGGTPHLLPVPTNRSPFGVALAECANDAGDWIGFYGSYPYALGIGDSEGKRDTARASGYHGVSIVGLDSSPTSGSLSVIQGLSLAQRIGVNGDIALLNCIVDSHSIMPIMVVDQAFPALGNVYLEALRFLVISNDQAHANPAGKTATTRIIRGHGAARWHILNCEVADGYELGDGLAGASEHFFYYDGQQGDSEVIGCKVRGPQWCGIQAVGRYTDRFQRNGIWQERYPFGKLLIEDCIWENVGSAGTACINITGGGLLDVIVKNNSYRANFTPPIGSGQVFANGWPGMAIQTYTDHKAWEVDDVNFPPGQGPSIALGYSMDPKTPNGLPYSPGLQGLIPEDGFGACRSMTIIGGTWYRNNGGTAPLFRFEDCAHIEIVKAISGVVPFSASGGPIMFANTGGLSHQNGKCGKGLVPSALPSGYWQQALFTSRDLPSNWLTVPIRMGMKAIGGSPVTLSKAEVDSW